MVRNQKFLRGAHEQRYLGRPGEVIIGTGQLSRANIETGSIILSSGAEKWSLLTQTQCHTRVTTPLFAHVVHPLPRSTEHVKVSISYCRCVLCFAIWLYERKLLCHNDSVSLLHLCSLKKAKSQASSQKSLKTVFLYKNENFGSSSL